MYSNISSNSRGHSQLKFGDKNSVSLDNNVVDRQNFPRQCIFYLFIYYCYYYLNYTVNTHIDKHIPFFFSWKRKIRESQIK
jgi:hypothetical protein